MSVALSTTKNSRKRKFSEIPDENGVAQNVDSDIVPMPSDVVSTTPSSTKIPPNNTMLPPFSKRFKAATQFSSQFQRADSFLVEKCADTASVKLWGKRLIHGLFETLRAHHPSPQQLINFSSANGLQIGSDAVQSDLPFSASARELLETTFPDAVSVPHVRRHPWEVAIVEMVGRLLNDFHIYLGGGHPAVGYKRRRKASCGARNGQNCERKDG